MRPEPQRLVDRREFPVLYVDDERENLRTFELSFRREFEVLTAQSGKEALDVINSRPVAVVLSDHRMPEMTGTEFLARVRAVDPHTVRLLVTAYGDAGTLAAAINSGSIYRYIPKPWDMDEMRMALCQAIDLYALESERDTLVTELTTLHAAICRIVKEPDVERMLHTAANTVVDELGFDAFAVLLDDGLGTLRAASVEPVEGDASEFLRSFEVDTSEGGTWMASFRSGQTELLRLEQSSELGLSARALLTEIAADEILSVPLSVAGQRLGVALIDNRRGGRYFRAAERMLLEGLAAQIALAVQSARRADRATPRSDCAPVAKLVRYGAAGLRIVDGADYDDVTGLLRLLALGVSCSGQTVDVGACIEKVLDEHASGACGVRLSFSRNPHGEMKSRLPREILESAVALILDQCLESSASGVIAVSEVPPNEIRVCMARGAVEALGSVRLTAAAALLEDAGGQIQAIEDATSDQERLVLRLP